MPSNFFHVTRWASVTTPTESLLKQIMKAQGVVAQLWSNSPHDIYSAHKHNYVKIIYVVSGSITFHLPLLKQKITLNAGDRLDLYANVVHSAEIGAEGVVCLEGHLEEKES